MCSPRMVPRRWVLFVLAAAACALAHVRPAAGLEVKTLAPQTITQGMLPEDVSITYGPQGLEWSGRVIPVSWSPRAFLFKDFLTDEECDHLTATARPQLAKSTVADAKTGQYVESPVRNSEGAVFPRGHDDNMVRIEQRIAAATMMPLENQEGLQIMRYQNGQQYAPHSDWFHSPLLQTEEQGGQRYLTMLMYLSTPEEGGETVFVYGPRNTGPQDPTFSACAKARGLSVKPHKRDALLFYSLTPDGKEDEMSVHASCPTTKGEKWIATKWVHVGPRTVGITSKQTPMQAPQDKAA